MAGMLEDMRSEVSTMTTIDAVQQRYISFRYLRPSRNLPRARLATGGVVSI